eukprot:GHVU01107991.1.p2 GENE.GHVU01107991.1~~GHVU01107991.1.p2  ORF type:complete len:100 (+),score=5.19 GHVU01107991.1:176-475(+)
MKTKRPSQRATQRPTGRTSERLVARASDLPNGYSPGASSYVYVSAVAMPVVGRSPNKTPQHSNKNPHNKTNKYTKTRIESRHTYKTQQGYQLTSIERKP